MRTAFNNSEIKQAALNLNGDNSGYEGGLIITKLIGKQAFSFTGSFIHATDNGSNKFKYDGAHRNALAYSLSGGRLLLPLNYTDYEQTNMNVMLEVLGQTNLHTGRSYIDLAPSIQFIFLSKMRLDAGYRFAVLNDLQRKAESGFLLKLEYNFFNVYK